MLYVSVTSSAMYQPIIVGNMPEGQVTMSLGDKLSHGTYAFTLGTASPPSGYRDIVLEAVAGYGNQYVQVARCGYTVQAAPPLQVSISAKPTSGNLPLAVSFSSQVSGGTPPYSYSWKFGDGSTDSSPNPTHTYNSQGAYLVTLSVSDSSGITLTSNSLTIQVANPPGHLAASIAPIDLSKPEMGKNMQIVVTFTNLGKGPISMGVTYNLIFDLVDYKGQGEALWQGLDTIAALKNGRDVLQEVPATLALEKTLSSGESTTSTYTLKISNDWEGDPAIFTNTLEVTGYATHGTDVIDGSQTPFRVWPSTEDVVVSLLTSLSFEIPHAFDENSFAALEAHVGVGASSLVLNIIDLSKDIAQKNWEKVGPDLVDVILTSCGACNPVALGISLAKDLLTTLRTVAYGIVVIFGFLKVLADRTGAELCGLTAAVFPSVNNLCVSAGSDVKLLVTTPDGSMVGSGLLNNQWQVFSQMKSSWYSGLDSHPQYVIIFGAPSGAYTISLTGNTTGSYHLNATLISTSGSVLNQYHTDQLGKGAIQSHVVLVSSEQSQLQIDPSPLTILWYTQRSLLLTYVVISVVLIAGVGLAVRKFRSSRTGPQKFCLECGRPLRPGAKYCLHDGTSARKEPR